MKTIRNTLLCLLLAAVIAAGSVICTHAALPPRKIGDADLDWDVTITDATKIQRWLADLTEMDKLSQRLGDVDGNGECNIIDATRIQRKLVDLDSFYEDWLYDWYIQDYRFFADYDSGKARVGTPVTFTAEVPNYVEYVGENPDVDGQTETPTHTFRFVIRKSDAYDKTVCVQERSEINTFTYTFTEPGSYSVECTIYNRFDQTAEARIWIYDVVEPYSLDKPVIVSTLFRDDTYCVSGSSPLYVRAEGGSGNYTYQYKIKTRLQLSGWDKDDEDTYTYGWTTEDVVVMPTLEEWTPSPAWIVTVVARDSEGNLSEPVEVEYLNDIKVG